MSSEQNRYTITEGHISVGVPGKACFCPIAVALCEQMGVPVGWAQLRVKVMPHVITLDGLKYRTPGSVQNWMAYYDTAGNPVQDPEDPPVTAPPVTAIGPFSFWLTPKDIIV